jgi:hypothetical protein
MILYQEIQFLLTLEKLLKLMHTDWNMNFMLPLAEKDLTTLLVVARERIENIK